MRLLEKREKKQTLAKIIKLKPIETERDTTNSSSWANPRQFVCQIGFVFC